MPTDFLKNCYNVGTIYGKGVAPIYAYGAPNWMTEDVINCYCLEESRPIPWENGTNYNNFTIYLTNNEMKEATSKLGEAFCSDNEGINNGYPILKWQLND